MVDKEYCQARKPENRFKVAINNHIALILVHLYLFKITNDHILQFELNISRCGSVPSSTESSVGHWREKESSEKKCKNLTPNLQRTTDFLVAAISAILSSRQVLLSGPMQYRREARCDHIVSSCLKYIYECGDCTLWKKSLGFFLT